MLSHFLLREARRRAGLTQAELASRAGTTQSAVARWESGRSLPSIEKLGELVECCGLELSVSIGSRQEAEMRLLEERQSLQPAERLRRLLAALPSLVGEDAFDATGAADDPEPFDPVAILSTLDAMGVRFVLVGGLAATLHGSPTLTTDVDVVPERSAANMQRLALALAELGAHASGTADPRAWTPDLSADGLPRSTVHRLATRFGPLDLLYVPTGTAGYDDLREQATRMDVGGASVVVASLSDVIRSKETAGRSDDRAVVPLLRRLQRLEGAATTRRFTPRGHPQGSTMPDDQEAAT